MTSSEYAIIIIKVTHESASVMHAYIHMLTCRLMALVYTHALTRKQLLFSHVHVKERYTVTWHMKRMADYIVAISLYHF